MVAHDTHKYKFNVTIVNISSGKNTCHITDFDHLEESRCTTSRLEEYSLFNLTNDRTTKLSPVKHEGTMWFMHLHVSYVL